MCVILAGGKLDIAIAKVSCACVRACARGYNHCSFSFTVQFYNNKPIMLCLFNNLAQIITTMRQCVACNTRIYSSMVNVIFEMLTPLFGLVKACCSNCYCVINQCKIPYTKYQMISLM